MAGLSHALRVPGGRPAPAVRPLLELGLLALWSGSDGRAGLRPERPLAEAASRAAATVCSPIPAAMAAARTVLPEGDCPAIAGPVRQVRETDGLEPILRLAARLAAGR